MNKEQNSNNAQNQQLNIAGVIPRLFYVVERNDEDTWEQISIGLKTYKEALDFLLQNT